MNNDLPRVFANKIDKVINNDQEVFYGKKNIRVNETKNVIKKINEIFSLPNFVYKKDVKIITSNGILRKTIVGISNNNLLTMDSESININDIQDIEII